MNACPWHATADIALQVEQAAGMKSLADASDNAASPPPRSLTPGRQSWPLKLEPYAIQAAKIDAPGVSVVEVRAKVDEAAKAELALQLADLANRDLNAPRVYPLLNNASFEPLSGAGPPTGWRLNSTTATAELDATSPQDGKTCLFFDNESGSSTLESDPFPMPPTGQLALTVHVRDQNLPPGSELRLVFEAVDAGRVYRRAAVVASGNAAAKPPAGQWVNKPILVNDLPLESRGEMRLRFEFIGPGEVWLDSIKLYDLLFPLKFYKYEEVEILQFNKLTHAAQSAYDEGRITDCVRQLERYWPRFLTEYTPLIQPAIVNQPAQQSLPPQAKKNEQPAPGLGERIKGIFRSVR